MAEQGRPGLYRPYGQLPSFTSMTLVVRSAGADPDVVGRQVAGRIRELDPSMAVADLARMEEVVADAIARPRLTSYVVGAFAALGETMKAGPLRPAGILTRSESMLASTGL